MLWCKTKEKGKNQLLYIALATLFVFFLSESLAWANCAGLVIRHGNGRVVTMCVRFEGETISGIELLKRSGLQTAIAVTGMGEAVYQIDGEGDPNGWVYKDGKCYYWAYYQLKSDRWVYSNTGASTRRVRNGDVDGWAWGPGGASSGAVPPVITFNQICPVETGSPSVQSSGSAQSQSSQSLETGRNQPAPSENQPTSPLNESETQQQSISSEPSQDSPSQTPEAGEEDSTDKSRSSREVAQADLSQSRPDTKGKNKNYLNYIALGIIILILTGIFVIYTRKTKIKNR